MSRLRLLSAVLLAGLIATPSAFGQDQTGPGNTRGRGRQYRS